MQHQSLIGTHYRRGDFALLLRPMSTYIAMNQKQTIEDYLKLTSRK